MNNIEIIIPTYNAGKKFNELAGILKQQKNITPNNIRIIDSSSTDDTVHIAKQAGFRVQIIKKEEFGHGRTRNMAATQSQADYLVFLTQDAIPAAPDAIWKLCLPLIENPSIGLTYGRQLPVSGIGILGNHARLFNYPAQSLLKTKRDIPRLGVKTIFCSDSFAAYNRKKLLESGNFPDVDFGEDTLIAAKFIKEGYAVYYNADACVYHAHSFTLSEDFQRSVIIGKLHHDNQPVFDSFGAVNGEGVKFVKSELYTLISHKCIKLLPVACFHNLVKFLGYRLGKSNIL